MRNRLLLCVAAMLLSACNSPERKNTTSLQSQPAADPIVAALDHFHHRDDLSFAPKPNHMQTVLLVKKHFNDTKGFISTDQMNGEFENEDWTIPKDALLDIHRRVDTKQPLVITPLPDFIRLIDIPDPPPDARVHYRWDFQEQYPDATWLISLWPAGYSTDGRFALVRFSFGPTPHGACATYLLEQRDGLWHVIHSKVAYYV